MAGKILFLAGILICVTAAASPQSIQADPSEMDGTARHANDAKLIAAPPVPSNQQQDFEQAVKDVHFDFDKSDLRAKDRAILASDADWLKAHPDVMITLEGDADERGSVVYNLMLSGERAMAAKNALVEMGVSPDRIAFATGWGKLYPVCTQSDESCWSQNRRTHLETWPPADQDTRVAAALAP